MIRLRNEKEILIIKEFIDNYKDEFEDFYITINNRRLFLKDYLFDYIKNRKKGEIILGDSEKGFIFTWGISDRANRKYLKIIYKDIKSLYDLFTVFLWNYNFFDWYIKAKSNNPIIEVSKKFGFKVIGFRGKELLLKRSRNNGGNS